MSALRAMVPTARTMVWGPLAGAIVALALLVVALRPWERNGLSLAVVRLTMAVAAAAAVFAVDDPAASTLGASPMSLAKRRVTRTVWVALGSGVASGSACLAMAVASGRTDVPMARALLECTGMLLAAIALALLFGADRGVAAFGGSLLAALVGQQRFPAYALFPFSNVDPSWDRAGIAWLVIALGAFAVIALVSRDPATGSLRPTSGAASFNAIAIPKIHRQRRHGRVRQGARGDEGTTAP